MKASYQSYKLQFKQASGTSRGILNTKETYYIILKEGNATGIGECGLLRGLSIDDRPDYEAKLQWVCDHIHLGLEVLYQELTAFPSIQIGLETAFISIASSTPFSLFPSSFSEGNDSIAINGLVWMGDEAFMKAQIKQRLEDGFTCIKMKIGAIDFNTEYALLKSLRKEYPASEIEIRVDANGAFSPTDAPEILKQLSDLELHSIEQPIATQQWEHMASLCSNTPLPIALDEELIGVFSSEEKVQLLEQINPQYIILKPSFIGGFQGTDQWIELAEQRNVGWWITSALESNVGLNAISQYTYTKNSKLPQGLGTGSLYTNNIDSPLTVENGKIYSNNNIPWNTKILNL